MLTGRQVNAAARWHLQNSTHDMELCADEEGWMSHSVRVAACEWFTAGDNDFTVLLYNTAQQRWNHACVCMYSVVNHSRKKTA